MGVRDHVSIWSIDILATIRWNLLKANSLAPQARDGIFMAQLALFNEEVRDHFPICGNFCEVLLVAGGFILFSLHMTMV